MNEIWYRIQNMTWTSVADILLVTLIFFLFLLLIRRTRAVQLLRGVILIVLLVLSLTSVVSLPALSWLIEKTIPALLLGIPIIFQPELRRAFERLGQAGSIFRGFREEREGIFIANIAQACQRLSERRHGALIVLERETGLQEYVDTGTLLDCELSRQLLETIFYPNTELHDGAVIMRDGRMAAAACVMPLSSGKIHTSDRHLGLRHRAALGISEVSDAIAVVVSEETGQISVAHNGRMIRRLDSIRLETILRAFFQPRFRYAWQRWLQRWRKKSSSSSA
ncbi:MAG: diadenylate cyclase CdaA [Anaerolineales bacterium]|nr:diadenylate cyclase CdaA [Anaerolineales bacterium]